MPARNVAAYVDEAISSIIAQTFEDFELVILDDASDDDTGARIHLWASRDDRIRVFRVETCLGPVASSNFVVEKARSDLVARMDADDVAHPDRLRLQYEAIEANPSAVLVGSLANCIDSKGVKLRGPDIFRLLAVSDIPFTHPSIMFRKQAFDRAGGYRTGTDYWEDGDLYARLESQGTFLVSPKPLVSIRFSVASSRFGAPRDEVERSLQRQYARSVDRSLALGQRPDGNLEMEVLLHFARYRVWSGVRGMMLFHALRRARLVPDRVTIGAISFLAWAEISPRSLRFLLRLRALFRSALARRKIHGDAVLAWPPPSGDETSRRDRE